jgi:hypothetical protein
MRSARIHRGLFCALPTRATLGPGKKKKTHPCRQSGPPRLAMPLTAMSDAGGRASETLFFSCLHCILQ